MNNNNIYKVLSNLNHDGTVYKKGQFVEWFEGCEQLVADKVLALVEGAESIAEAIAIDAKASAEASEGGDENKEVEPENTWGPKPDETDKTPEDEGKPYDGPMGKYEVLGDIFPLNPDGSQQENALEYGSIQEVPTEVGNEWVEQGLAKVVVEGGDENKDNQ